jgi:hypothetical protein
MTRADRRGVASGLAWLGLALGSCTASPAAAPAASTAAPTDDEPGPRFDAAGALQPPTDYRSWVFLTSGFAMSYGPVAQAALAGGVDVLDNVYVTPAAYRAFRTSGRWPEATMFVLEIRTAEETGSIVTRGRYQTELVGIEAAVKDTARFGGGGWAYFDFAIDGEGPIAPATALPATASCQACHAKNAAVEQTFTQFYPTLLPVAEARGTVRPDFVGIPPSAGELVARLARDGWGTGQALADIAARWPGATVLRESSLNRVAYRLHDQKHPAAIAVFEDVARRFPASANAWDSLSEAYEGAAMIDAARGAVTRGLAALAADRAMPAPRRTALEASLRQRQQRLP